MATFGSPHPRRMVVPTGSAGAFPRGSGTYTAPGVIVPWGSLDTWFQFVRSESAVRRGEIVVYGDSTTFGSGGLYSWLTRLRSRAVSAGWTDGGKGIFALGEDQLLYDAGEINGIVSNNFIGTQDNYDTLQGGFLYDNAAVVGRTVTLQFKGSTARLWYRNRFDCGDFTYAVDGGAPVTVNVLGTSTRSNFIYLSGLNPATTHTIVITNLCGRAAAAPLNVNPSQSGSPGAGTYGAGTYYYVVTGVTSGSGETVASAVAPFTNGTNTNVLIQFAKNGLTSYNLYRGTSASGPFSLASAAFSSATSSLGQFVLDGTVTFNSGVNPPATGTTQLNTSAQFCSVALAPMFDTGFTLQKQAVSGATFTNYFMGAGSPTPTSPYTYGADALRTGPPLGLTSGTQQGPDYTVGMAVDATVTSGKVKPVLAMADLGFNDLSGSGYNVDPAYWVEYVKRFGALCKVAGVSGIVVSGQLPYNASWPTSGPACFAALRDTAAAQGLAFVDLFYPVGGASLSYAGGTNNPHLTQAQYQAQGDFLWDNVLSLGL